MCGSGLHISHSQRMAVLVPLPGSNGQNFHHVLRKLHLLDTWANGKIYTEVIYSTESSRWGKTLKSWWVHHSPGLLARRGRLRKAVASLLPKGAWSHPIYHPPPHTHLFKSQGTAPLNEQFGCCRLPTGKISPFLFLFFLSVKVVSAKATCSKFSSWVMTACPAW